MDKEKKIQRLWKRLFGERDEATFRHLTYESFEKTVKFLEKIKTSVEWEADRSSRKIIIWKPRKDLRETRDFFLLLAMLQAREGEENYES